MQQSGHQHRDVPLFDWVLKRDWVGNTSSLCEEVHFLRSRPCAKRVPTVIRHAMVSGHEHRPIAGHAGQHVLELPIQCSHAFIVHRRFQPVNLSSVVGASKMGNHEVVRVVFHPAVHDVEGMTVGLRNVLKAIIRTGLTSEHGVRIQVNSDVKTRERD